MTEKKGKDDAQADSPGRSTTNAGGLPISCVYSDNDNPLNITFELKREGWTYETREEVVRKALTYAGPEGMVSLDAEYDKERAEQLLRESGWVNVNDFIKRGGESEERKGSIDEIGWHVSMGFEGNIEHAKATQIARSMFISPADEDFVDSDDEDLASFLAGSSSLEKRLFPMLRTASSFQYAYFEYTYSHTDFPSAGKEQCLMFVTSDNQRAELIRSRNFEVI